MTLVKAERACCYGKGAKDWLALLTRRGLFYWDGVRRVATTGNYDDANRLSGVGIVVSQELAALKVAIEI